MKLNPSHLIATSHFVGRTQPPVWPAAAAADTDEWAAHTQLVRPMPVRRSQFSATRWVVLLAFGQSLLFLALWLWCCVAAGAATAEGAPGAGTLRLSTYEPKNTRDPFSRGAAVAGAASVAGRLAAVDPTGLRLEGVLYDAASPSAIINEQLVTLNRPVQMTVGGRQVRVKATAITRSQVTLDVDGQTVTLRLDPDSNR